MTCNIKNNFRKEHPAIPCTKLKDITDQLMEYDVIGIDEGQFYEDVHKNFKNFSWRKEQMNSQI